jgi:demethylspheroidene O-methyltransferase
MPRQPDAGALAATPVPTRAPWLERLRDWRRRTVARPGFQRWAAGFPLTRRIARREARELFDLVAGFVYSQVLLACVRLDLFERLAGGARPVAALREATALGDDALRRLLAAAVSLELLEWRRDDRIALGRLGAPMVGNRALAAMVEHHATLYGDLADPVALLRGAAGDRGGPGGPGGPAPAMAGYWPYAAVDGPVSPAALAPERVAAYSELMSASQPLVAAEVLDAYDFGRHRCLLDVGGGEGTFLRAVAERAPALQLMLFDLPAVAERAHARFAAWGLAGRAQAFGGDFFDDALPPGADVVSLVRVAFDHPDDRVLRLLRNVRRALPDGGTLVLAEPMAGARGAEAVGDAYFGFYLLAMGRGRPRTARQLGALLDAAGFGPVSALPTRLPLQAGVLVARCRPSVGQA